MSKEQPVIANSQVKHFLCRQRLVDYTVLQPRWRSSNARRSTGLCNIPPTGRDATAKQTAGCDPSLRHNGPASLACLQGIRSYTATMGTVVDGRTSLALARDVVDEHTQIVLRQGDQVPSLVVFPRDLETGAAGWQPQGRRHLLVLPVEELSPGRARG